MDIKKVLKFIFKPFLPICFKVIPESANIIYYRRVFRRLPNLVKPKTFNEKIIHKIVFDRNPKLTLFADKFLVRDFVKSKLGGDTYLTKLYAVVDNPEEIHNLKLPDQFVMKPNHLSGEVKIVQNFKSSEIAELERLAKMWLQRNYYYGYFAGWAYKNIKPRIIFEEFLEFDGKVPDDWKFFCFNGEPRFIQIDRSRFVKHQRNIYDLDLSVLPVRIACDNFQDKINVPQNFDKMLEIARKLSSGTDFIRVDLYNINGKIMFGELTNYPAGGLEKIEPTFWDIKFGSYWKR